ncbi:MAG: response regulator [Armatimonadota bacterium]|nr:MAG: response regulator [Armatimonadota bacterium]
MARTKGERYGDGMMNLSSDNGDSAPRKRVLVVDDDDELARELQSIIERHGFAVRRAENGAVALDMIQRERPDIILLDVVMPVMDGFQLLAALHEIPEARDIPVIVLSVGREETTVSAARHAGAAVYLPKPFSPHELIAVLRRVAGIADEPPGDEAAQPAEAASGSHG